MIEYEGMRSGKRYNPIDAEGCNKSIPDGVIAACNPCCVIRQINEEDWRMQLMDYQQDRGL